MPRRSIDVNPFTASGLFYHNSLDRSISKSRVPVFFIIIIITMFFFFFFFFFFFMFLLEITVVNANNVDPDQTPRSAASDLGLHCLPMSLFLNNVPFLVMS